MADVRIDIESELHRTREDLDSINQKLDQLTDKAGKADDKMQKLSDRAVAAGKKMSLYVTAPILAAAGASIKLGMDAVESRNLFEVSMGAMTQAADRWSANLSDKMGINRYESQRLIGTFNVMLKSLGQNEEAAFDMAKGMAELGYDMASFFNLEPEEAFDKLRAAITGETEPLKRLGIVVNETTIKQWALNNGMIKQGQVLTESQKIVARYNVIMERTAAAQGDMARTLDSPANKLRILKSRITETATEIGIKLLPAFEKILGHVEKAVKWFSDLSDANQKQIMTLAGIAAAAGPVLITFGKLIKLAPKMRAAFAMMTGPLGIIVTAAAAAGAALDHFIDKSIEKSDQEIEAMVGAASSHADYWAFRKKLIDEEILTVDEFKEIYEKHGRDYKRVMVAISKLPEYEYLRDAWTGMSETVKEESTEMADDFDVATARMKIAALSLQLELDKWKLPKIVKSPEELLSQIGFTGLDETFQAEWDKTMFGAEESTNKWLNNLVGALDTSESHTKESMEKSGEWQNEFFNEAMALGSMFASQSKELAYAMAIVNVAQAVTKALAEYPPPFSFIMAAAQAAAGAIQIAAIASQPIPSADKGAYFPEDTLVQAHKEELISPIPIMKETFREVIRESGPTENHFHIMIPNQLDPYSADRITKDQIIPQILASLDENRNLKTWQSRLRIR